MLFNVVICIKRVHGLAPDRLCDNIEMYFERHGLNTIEMLILLMFLSHGLKPGMF